MMHSKFFLQSASLLLFALAGCSGTNRQLATCQADKDQLLGTIRNQRDTTRALNQQVASLEMRLDQAEKVLARGETGTRLSSRPPEGGPRAPEPAGRLMQPPAPTPLKSDSLPWRSPASKPEPAAAPEAKTRASNAKPSGTASLVSLARRDSRLQYDAKAQAARVDLPIAFDEKSATLTAADKLKLDELAKLLKADDARELRVVVAGQGASSAGEKDTARAQAVADYLDSHGIAGSRLAVTRASAPAVGKSGSTDSMASKSPVQIYLLEPNTPIAGWESPEQPVRR